MNGAVPPGVSVEAETSARNVATLVYALQAASFLVGITYIVAIIVNYVKVEDVRGTLAESHFRWQMRTFWFSLLWSVVGAILTLVLVGFVILGATCIWIIYRVVKGWMRLNDGKPMYV